MKNTLGYLISIIFFFLPSLSWGFIDSSVFYGSDSLKTQTSQNSSLIMGHGTFGFSVDKLGFYNVGWSVLYHSARAKSDASEDVFGGLYMGPRLLMFFSRSKIFSLGLAYYPLSTAITDFGSEETWRGQGFHVDIGGNLPLGENFLLTLRLNQVMIFFSEKLEGSTNFEEVSYTQSNLYPTLGFIYQF